MLGDTFLDYATSELQKSIEELRSALETCEPEDLRHLQGQILAKREMLAVMREQMQQWLEAEDTGPGTLDLSLAGEDEPISEVPG